MFKIDKDKTTILITRGNKGTIKVKKKKKLSGDIDKFKKGDTVIFTVKKSFDENNYIMRKTIQINEDSDYAIFEFSKEDTLIGDLISKPVKFQYDISLNGDNTILGYDDDTGAKILKIYPEGSNDE